MDQGDESNPFQEIRAIRVLAKLRQRQLDRARAGQFVESAREAHRAEMIRKIYNDSLTRYGFID